MKEFDYKDYLNLKKYMSKSGRILSRKKTGLSAKDQRKLAKAIKRARFLALLPYISKE